MRSIGIEIGVARLAPPPFGGAGMQRFIDSIAGFGLYFSVAIGLTAAFVILYTLMTPHKEIALVRAGNAAAALGLGGAVLGFSIPLALVISVSGDLLDVAVCGAVALVVQIAGHAASRMLLPALSADIAAGKMSAAIVQAAVALILGLLQAACWTP